MTQEALDNLLVYLMGIIKQGVEFSTENIPAWINQILEYKVFVNSFTLVFFCAFLLITFLVFLKFRKKIADLVYYNSDGILLYAAFVIAWLVSITIIISSVSNLVMINIAPMYYLMKLMNIAM